MRPVYHQIHVRPSKGPLCPNPGPTRPYRAFFRNLNEAGRNWNFREYPQVSYPKPCLSVQSRRYWFLIWMKGVFELLFSGLHISLFYEVPNRTVGNSYCNIEPSYNERSDEGQVHPFHNRDKPWNASSL